MTVNLLIEGLGLIGAFALFFKIQMLSTFFILLIFYLIFRNLTHKKQKVSAYSLFNENFAQIPGTFGSELPGLGAKTTSVQKIEVQNKDLILEYFDKAQKMGKAKCFCGSGKIFKKCCMTKKKEYFDKIFN